MQLSHILLKTPLLVDPVMKSIEQGADFAQLARDHSACPSKDEGGSLGITDIASLPIELHAEIKQAHAGQVVGPIESRHGIHLIKIESAA